MSAGMRELIVTGVARLMMKPISTSRFRSIKISTTAYGAIIKKKVNTGRNQPLNRAIAFPLVVMPEIHTYR